MNEETKAWIDNADYQTLLAKWRFAPAGSPLFQGETGEYYKKIMVEKRDALPDHGVSASKAVDW